MRQHAFITKTRTINYSVYVHDFESPSVGFGGTAIGHFHFRKPNYSILFIWNVIHICEDMSSRFLNAINTYFRCKNLSATLHNKPQYCTTLKGKYFNIHVWVVQDDYNCSHNSRMLYSTKKPFCVTRYKPILVLIEYRLTYIGILW